MALYVLAPVLALMLVCASISAGDDSIGATKIRFYTGNLSVGYFMEYWGTGKVGPNDRATPEFCAQMKSVGVSAVCDYLAWCRIEPDPGKWDWTFYDENERILHSNGLGYNVYCWLHFPPKWFTETPDYVPYRCAEHNEPVQQTSIWAPGTLAIYERFYKALAAHFGDKIDFLRLSTPAEYGEIGYPSGMTNWLVKQEHVHSGFWCGDEHARADFRAAMKKRYVTTSSLNKAWGTSLKSFDEIAYPPIAKDRAAYKDPEEMTPSERRWILDFIGWYYDGQTEFARKAIGVVRKHFPGKEIIVSMGYGSQNVVYGNDDVGVSRMCRDEKIACQTPGNIPYFCMKSLSSPCRFYGVPYYTEPPGNVGRNDQVHRVWSDASCGTQTFFDYPGNLTGAKDLLAKYKDCLDGARSVVDIAFFFPTTDHRLRYQDWPVRTMRSANHFRELLDYDLVDERMVRDGALDRYRILIACDGSVIQARTLPILEKWLKAGGILLVRDFGPIETVDGDRSFYGRVFPENGGLGELLKRSSRKVGKGCVIVVPSEKDDEPRFARLAADLAHNLSKHFPGKMDVPLIDDAADGVSATLYRDRILYLNFTDNPVEKTVRLRESDFRTRKPESLEHKLSLEPHSIIRVELR